MEHIDLFSGTGCFSLACQWAGIETILFCEIDPFCQKILKKHWPNVPIVKDVNNVKEIKEIIDATYSQGGADRKYSPELEGRGNNSGCIQRDSKIATYANRNRLQESRTEQQAGGDRQLLQAAANTQAGRIQARTEQPSQASNLRGLDTIRRNNDNGLLLTAGFPCQPFSAAGRRKGSADDRYLWPQTLTVIEAVRPDWVLLENVAGILSMVFPDSGIGVANQATLFTGDSGRTGSLGNNRRLRKYDTVIDSIMESLKQAGYKAKPLVVPACSVGAPHRRDRVWIIAHSEYARRDRAKVRREDIGIQQEESSWEKLCDLQSSGEDSIRNDGQRDAGYEAGQNDATHPNRYGQCDEGLKETKGQAQYGIGRGSTIVANSNSQRSGARRRGLDPIGQEKDKEQEKQSQPEHNGHDSNVADSNFKGLQREFEPSDNQGQKSRDKLSERCIGAIPNWHENWHEVAARFCRVDDGSSHRLDRNRTNRLKALGNAIVPQIAYQVIKAIVAVEEG